MFLYLLLGLELGRAPVEKGSVACRAAGDARGQVEQPGHVAADAEDCHMVVDGLDGRVLLARGHAGKVLTEADVAHDVKGEVAGPRRRVESALLGRLGYEVVYLGFNAGSVGIED